MPNTLARTRATVPMTMIVERPGVKTRTINRLNKLSLSISKCIKEKKNNSRVSNG